MSTKNAKTTIYLPESLRTGVKRLAAASGRSEAEVIRDAIHRLIEAMPPPRPRGALYASGDAALSDEVDSALTGFGER
ncbi:MAG: CopG family transcriptional regulator [Actinomycetota bacterium]